MFAHLSGRSTYSLLEGLGSVNDLLNRVNDLGQTAVALTDLYGMYGAVDFYSKAKGTTVKPIIGVELPFVPHVSTYHHQRHTSIPTLSFLARNHNGYHQLMRLVSASYAQAVDDIPLVDLPLLEKYAQDMILVVGGIGSYVYHQDEEGRETVLDQYIHTVGPENIVMAVAAQSYDLYPDLQSLNNTLRTYAQKKSLTAVAISQYYYILPEHKSTYHTALAIKDGKKIYDADIRTVKGDHHILSEDEVRKHLATQGWSGEQIDLMIDNTVKIADSIETKITLGQALFPNFTPSSEMIELYEKVKGELVEKS